MAPKPKGILAWKLVTHNRQSLLHGFLAERSWNHPKLEKVCDRLLKHNIIKTYTPNKLVVAAKYTSGIVCFVSKECAEDWAFPVLDFSHHIIQVRGFQPLPPPRRFLSFVAADWTTFLKTHSIADVADMDVPAGTVCYARVRVLD